MRHDDWLVRQLPVGMTDGDVLTSDPPLFVRFVALFQQVADTVIGQVDTLPHMFDPTVAPDDMVRLMASWFGVEWVDSSLDDRLQREIVMRYADLISWRGTKRGLVQLLELLTDGDVDVRDSGGVFAEGEAPGGPAHVRLDVERLGWRSPNRPTQSDLSLPDFVRIVRDELPATVTFDLWVAGQRMWPSADEPPARTGHRPAAAQADLSSADGPVAQESDDA